MLQGISNACETLNMQTQRGERDMAPRTMKHLHGDVTSAGLLVCAEITSTYPPKNSRLRNTVGWVIRT